MYNRYSFIEFVLLLVLFHAGWNVPSTSHQPCPWDKSRLVKHIVNKKLLPILSRYRVNIPLDCPFHPERDVFARPGIEPDVDNYVSDQEEWVCPVCGESFQCERQLDLHWEGAHSSSLVQTAATPQAECHRNTGEDTVCLADYCDIMRCDVLGPRLKAPKMSPKSSSSSPPPPPCDQVKLAALQNKCQGIIRQCIVGLLASLSLKDFRDIEEDLNEAICSYLTCDLYWQDFKQEVRKVPLLFCVLIMMVVIGGFFLCYFLVWALFEYPLQQCNGFQYGHLTSAVSSSYDPYQSSTARYLVSPSLCKSPH